MTTAAQVYGAVIRELANALDGLGFLLTSKHAAREGYFKDTTYPDITVIIRRAAYRLEHGDLDGWFKEEMAREARVEAERWAKFEMQMSEKTSAIPLRDAHGNSKSESALENYYDSIASADVSENCELCNGCGWLRRAREWEVCLACQNPSNRDSPASGA